MNLLVFGHGYSAAAFTSAAREHFSQIAVTVRTPDKAQRLAGQGFDAHVFDGLSGVSDALAVAIGGADAILVSVPPGEAGDPVLAAAAAAIAAAPALGWVGYLSTVGVYGDHGGAWVDEDTPCRPVSRRSVQRVAAEEAWARLGAEAGRRVHIFRLSGIYGPGRNALENLRAGTARRIDKPGQVFNRIHVADIAGALMASLRRPDAEGGVYNVTDDEPAPPQDVVAHAAALLGVPPPPLVPFEQAELSPMGRSFYGENKRVSNRRIKERLGFTLRYPTYREGLAACLDGLAP